MTVLPGLTPDSENLPSASVADEGPPPGTDTRAANPAALLVPDPPAQPLERLEADRGDRGAFAVQPYPIGEVRHETGMANCDSVARAAQQRGRGLECP